MTDVPEMPNWRPGPAPVPAMPCRVCGVPKPVNERCVDYDEHMADLAERAKSSFDGGKVVEYPVTDIENNPFAQRAGAEELVDVLEDMDAVATSHGERLLRTFRFEHLPRGPIRSLSAEFAGLATIITEYIPASAERTLALRDLWQAKNYAVFAVSDMQRGKPDDDGHIVGAERKREGSSETAQKAALTACDYTWPFAEGEAHVVGMTNHHYCEYADEHPGRHLCYVCGATA